MLGKDVAIGAEVGSRYWPNYYEHPDEWLEPCRGIVTRFEGTIADLRLGAWCWVLWDFCGFQQELLCCSTDLCPYWHELHIWETARKVTLMTWDKQKASAAMFVRPIPKQVIG